MKKILTAIILSLLFIGCLEKEPEIMDGKPWKKIPRDIPILLK